jgi:hypothetical protein
MNNQNPYSGKNMRGTNQNGGLTPFKIAFSYQERYSLQRLLGLLNFTASE